MSVKIMGLVWDYKIPRDEKFILLAYADHASHDGANVYPSVKTISEKTGYSERSVQVITRKLEKMGLLIPNGKGSKGTNKWSIPLEWGAEIAPAEIAGVQKAASASGAENGTQGVQPTAPKPSNNNQKQPSLNNNAKSATANQVPEIILFREITERYPARDTFQIVIEAIQKINIRLGRLAVREDILPFWHQWRTNGWKPTNLAWLTDWAVTGIIPGRNNSSAQNSIPKGISVAQSWLAKKQQEIING